MSVGGGEGIAFSNPSSVFPQPQCLAVFRKESEGDKR